jgi:hypothetical protein
LKKGSNCFSSRLVIVHRIIQVETITSNVVAQQKKRLFQLHPFSFVRDKEIMHSCTCTYPANIYYSF